MTTKIKTTNIGVDSITTTQILDGSVTTSKIGNISIDALSDVNTTSVAPTNGQALVWDAFNSRWVPTTIATGSAVDIINPFMLAGM